MDMTEYRCPYCGQNTLTHQNEQYTCTSCGIISAQLELDRELKRLSQDTVLSQADHQDAGRSEEEVLQKVLQLMRAKKSGWEQPLELLFQHGYPLQHPAEFIIYRGICQTAPLLQCAVFSLEARYSSLDALIANIQQLKQFLPENDSEQYYQTLKRINDALMLFGDQPVNYHYCYNIRQMWERYNVNCQLAAEHKLSTGKLDFRDKTGEKRAALLGLFADLLETLSNGPHGLEYLKMACKLWHNCLKHARGVTNYYYDIRYKPLYDAFPYEEYYIPKPMFKQIAVKIRQLNETIRQRDPNFTPEEPPSVLSDNDRGRIVLFTVYTAAVLVIFWLVYCLQH